MLVTISTNNMDMAKENLSILREKVGKVEIHGNLILNDGTKGLPEIYNNSVELFPGEEEYIFMHHDLIMETNKWYKKIKRLKSKCDIIGLAGTTNFDIKDGRWWFNSGIPAFSSCFGAVKHTKDGYEWITKYGPTPRTGMEVIDGLFIYAKRKVFDGGLRFDERFKFHFYDVSFCLRAIRLGFKIGVADIMAKHLSIGEMPEEYEVARRKFIELYG